MKKQIELVFLPSQKRTLELQTKIGELAKEQSDMATRFDVQKRQIDEALGIGRGTLRG